MKNIALILFFTIMSQNMNAQNKMVAFFKKDIEPGKCYRAGHLEVLEDSLKDKMDTVYYEIVAPIYQSKVSTVEELVKNGNGRTDDFIMVEVKQAAIGFKYFENHRGQKIENATQVCCIEIPAKYQKITYTNRDSILKLLIVRKELVEHGKVRVIAKEDIHPAMQIFKLPSIHYEWLEYIGAPVCGSYGVLDVQKALNKKGYKCMENGILDSETKNALLQFQKDNKLPEGRLDIQTLKKLISH